MQKTFNSLVGTTFTVDFTKHDISKYDYLLHVTRKDLRSKIMEEGLLINQPPNKSLLENSGLLFLSYPQFKTTVDCFRWYDETCSLIVLDTIKLVKDGFEFYDDYFSKEDVSSNRNHLCIDKNIPKEYIIKFLEF